MAPKMVAAWSAEPIVFLRLPIFRLISSKVQVKSEHLRPANSHGFAVSLTIFCHFSRSPDKAPNLTVFWEKSFWKEVN